jgi:signal peptide peptidase SppA
MAQFLPFVMQQLFNRPLAMSDSTANMIVAALSGRLDIRSLATESERMDRRALEDLAAMGRVEADQRKASDDDRPSVACDDEWYGDNPYKLTESGVAIIPVKGVLKRTWGVGPYSGATGYDGIWAQMLHAYDNPLVKAVWFDINSGGGAVDGCFDLTDGIYQMSARFGGKPTYAMCADFAASAAYAIASACDTVIVPRLGQVGSIGCVIMHAEFSKMLEEDGVNVNIVRSRSRKARGNELEAIDEQTLSEFQEMVDEVDTVFTEAVVRYRGSDVLTKNAIGEMDGRVYSGNRALATGLVDYVMSEPEAWMMMERQIAAEQGVK